jgi:hypothetical protein
MSNDYLSQLLADQSLNTNSPEVVEMEEQRLEIENYLNKQFESSTITLVQAGSWAKNTMVRPSYDIDLVCYFDSDDTTAGNSIEEIFETVKEKLEEEYKTKKCTSVIRILTPKDDWSHIDVVPGRYVDESKSDAWICLSDDKEKDKRKTNLDTHITTVRDSGCIDVIKLAKLWRAAGGFKVRTFVLDLLVIEIMKQSTAVSLEDRFETLLTEISENIDSYSVEDPANPTGNPLDAYFDDEMKERLSTAAASTLALSESDGWEKVFTSIGSTEKASAATLTSLSSLVTPVKPYAEDGK